MPHSCAHAHNRQQDEQSESRETGWTTESQDRDGRGLDQGVAMEVRGAFRLGIIFKGKPTKFVDRLDTAPT